MNWGRYTLNENPFDGTENPFDGTDVLIRTAARQHLNRIKGKKAPHGLKWGQRVSYRGKEYILYDHDAEGSGSLAVVVTPDLLHFKRGIRWDELARVS